MDLATETHSHTATAPRPWLHYFTLLTALATLALIGVGGLVTSHGVGMAVPDWPNTYGYNMFFFPFSKWVGGIFYEHSHRLVASGVGFFTTVLAFWLFGKNARMVLRSLGAAFGLLGLITCLAAAKHRADGLVLVITGLMAFGSSFVWPRREASPRWLRHLGLVAFFAVLLQGILGGLRVVLFKDQIGIFHATLAQLFFVLTCSLALFTSPWWERTQGRAISATAPTVSRGLLRLLIFTTLIILGQLVLGATMRHQHAGLSIPDFPLAYSKIWPALDSASVASYNQHRLEVIAANPITAVQIVLQLLHRLTALVILGLVGWCALRVHRQLGSKDYLARLAAVWLSFILLQVLLGAATIWSNKAADIATLHVLVGALSLASGGLLSILAYRRSEALAGARSPVALSSGPAVAFGSRPSTVAGH